VRQALEHWRLVAELMWLMFFFLSEVFERTMPLAKKKFPEEIHFHLTNRTKIPFRLLPGVYFEGT
jgi:hypothetical protein